MDTYGWDTIFACSLERANRALAAATQDRHDALEVRESGLRLSARLGPWRIVPGGSRQLLHLQVPLAKGVLEHGGSARALDGVCARLEVSLRLLAADADGAHAPDDAAAPRRGLLTFDLGAVNTDPKARGPGMVTPLGVDDPQGVLTPLERELVGEAVARHLVEDAGSLAVALAEIDLVDHDDASLAAWLRPAHSDYGYFETQDGRHVFCIFGAVRGTRTEGLVPGLDPALVEGDGEGALALCPHLFMRRVVQPMLARVYGVGAETHFAYDPEAHAITSTRTLDPAKVAGYEPKLTKLRVALDRDALALRAEGTCDMNFLGVSMSFTLSARSALTFDPGSQALGFAPDPEPRHEHTYQIPPGTRVLLWLAGGLPGLAMEIAVPGVAAGIAAGLSQQAGECLLAQQSTRSVRWAGTRGFTARRAALRDAFILRGAFA